MWNTSLKKKNKDPHACSTDILAGETIGQMISKSRVFEKVTNAMRTAKAEQGGWNAGVVVGRATHEC